MSAPSVRRVPDVPRHLLVLYAVCAIAVLALGARYLTRAGGAPAGPDRAAPALQLYAEGGARGRVTVHVAGRVRRPGGYRLAASARVDDAVRRAGGTRAGADLSAVNLAAKLEDGRQIVVPARAPSGGGAASASAPGVPLNLNTATPEQLDELDGIGPATAETIVEYREERGGFGRVDELAQVPGIGEKRMAALREQVRV